MRDQVLARSTICHLCGRPGADTVDHIIPVAKGGAVYDPANLAPAHGRGIPGICVGNYGRGSKPIAATRTPEPKMLYGFRDGLGRLNRASRAW